MHMSKADVWARLQQLLLYFCHLEGAETGDDNDEISEEDSEMSEEWEDDAIEEEDVLHIGCARA